MFNQVVTEHAVLVPVTSGLNAEITGFLPVHCIYQLLKSKAFNKHRVLIKSWIYAQVCESRTPLHPLLPKLIEVYVSSILTVTPIKNNQGMPAVMDLYDPISEEEIRVVFAHLFPKDVKSKKTVIEYSITTQLLLLYYALLYEDTRLSQVKSYLQSGINVPCYSQTFFAELPIRYLVNQAEKEQHLYEGRRVC